MDNLNVHENLEGITPEKVKEANQPLPMEPIYAILVYPPALASLGNVMVEMSIEDAKRVLRVSPNSDNAGSVSKEGKNETGAIEQVLTVLAMFDVNKLCLGNACPLWIDGCQDMESGDCPFDFAQRKARDELKQMKEEIEQHSEARLQWDEKLAARDAELTARYAELAAKDAEIERLKEIEKAARALCTKLRPSLCMKTSYQYPISTTAPNELRELFVALAGEKGQENLARDIANTGVVDIDDPPSSPETKTCVWTRDGNKFQWTRGWTGLWLTAH